MRIVAQPHINTEPLEARRAYNALWLVEVLAWIGDMLERYAPAIAKCPLLRRTTARCRSNVAHDLRDAVRALRTLVFVHAIARMRFVGRRRWQKLYPGRGQTLRARDASNLCKHATAHLFRGMHRGSLRQRAERLAAYFANLEPLIARTLKRLNAMHRTPRSLLHTLVVTHDVCVSLIAPGLAASADTS